MLFTHRRCLSVTMACWLWTSCWRVAAACSTWVGLNSKNDLHKLSRRLAPKHQSGELTSYTTRSTKQTRGGSCAIVCNRWLTGQAMMLRNALHYQLHQHKLHKMCTHDPGAFTRLCRSVHPWEHLSNPELSWNVQDESQKSDPVKLNDLSGDSGRELSSGPGGPCSMHPQQVLTHLIRHQHQQHWQPEASGRHPHSGHGHSKLGVHR